MAKTSRLELRVDPELKARVEAEAGRLGQKVATFVERALEKALAVEALSQPQLECRPERMPTVQRPVSVNEKPDLRQHSAPSRALSSAHVKRDVKPRPKKPK